MINNIHDDMCELILCGDHTQYPRRFHHMYAMRLYELINPRDGRIAYSEQSLAQTGVFMRHVKH